MAKKRSSSSTDTSLNALSSVKLPNLVSAAIGLIAIGFIVCLVWTKLTTPQVTIDTTTVTAQLMKCQDLVTAKLQYRGLVTYEEGSIAFIDKKGFTMQYDASVSAGVDLADAKVDVEENVINIELPKSELKSIEIDPDSIQFYDQEYALFNWQNRSDTTEALKIAKEDANSKVDSSNLLTEADEQARTTVETLFSILTGENGYTLNVTTVGEAADTEATASTETAATSEAGATTEAATETASK